jgi:hypothetical protein
VIAATFSAVACAGTPPPAAPPPPPAAPSAAQSSPPTSTVTPHATAAPFAEKVDFPNQLEDFNAARFTNPTKSDNPWFLLTPGTKYVYDGFAEEAGERKKHQFILTVTDMTKEVMGVRATVVWDQDFVDGELAESELALFAQADDGNVWHFGQYPEVYDAGQVVESPAWVAGIAGARPGITIKKEPQLGGPSYSQGWSPVVPWTDRARVAQIGVQDCVPQGCYVNGIVTEEFSREEPNAFQLKYYAPGIGNTRVDFTGQDQTKEKLELTSFTQLDKAGLDEARAKVLEQEQRSKQHSKAVWALLPPMQQRPAGS